MRLPAIVVFLLASPVFAGQVVLQNEKADDMSMLAAQQGFASGEGIGETFMVPAKYDPFRLVGVQFIAAGGNDHLTAKFYKDKGAVDPGGLLGMVDQDVTGSTMFVQEMDLASPVMVDSGPIRIALFTSVGGPNGGIQFADDPATKSDQQSTLCAIMGTGACQWYYAKDLGVSGTWVLRLVIDTDAVAGPDGGTGDMRGGGGPDGGTTGTSGDPEVDSITPDSVVQGMGGRALIRGQNFMGGADKSIVTFDGPKGPVTIGNVLVDDDKTIEVQIPESLEPATYDVIVESATTGHKGVLRQGLTVTPSNAKTGCTASPAGPGNGKGTTAVMLGMMMLLLALRRRRIR